MANIDPIVLNYLTRLAIDAAGDLIYTDENQADTRISLSANHVHLSGPNSPVGAVTPMVIDQPYNQIAADRVVQWVSTGTGNNDWVAIGGTAIQKTFDPNETPAYAGQEWQNVTISSTGGASVNRIWTGVNVNGPANTTSWQELRI